MQATLRLLSLDEPVLLAPDTRDFTLTSGLERLQNVCNARQHADLKLESASCELGASLAHMVTEARLANAVLPRGYRARQSCGEAYLVKQELENDEPRFILARRETVFARMEPKARELSNAQIMEFMRDVESGLIDEIADFVEGCNQNDERAASCLQRALLVCRNAKNEPIQLARVAETPSYSTVPLPSRKPRGRRALGAK